MYDIQKIREDFPILGREVYGKPLIYVDNGATTQKPRCVVEAITDEYYSVNANVHRGVHFLSQQATELHEASRETVRKFINARSSNEIVFTRGTTESINLLASSFAESQMKEGDEVIVSTMEHHSNIVPWQLQAEKRGIVLKVIPMNDKGELLIDAYEKLFSERTKLVSLVHVSNVLGTVNPVKEMIATAHSHGVPVLIDGAQSVPHMKVDVQDLDADFFAFSGHKIYGPTGVGVLYGKEEWLDKLPPYQGGGEMIQNVSFEKTTFNELPFKFEAGTPDYIGTTALAKALDYVSAIGMDKIAAYENELTAYAMKRLKSIEGMRIFGEAEHKSGVISFLVGNIHHLDMLWADAMVIAPATASSIGKMAHGIADNMLITTYLSMKAPVFVAPAMDLDMFAHPSTQQNLERLRSYGNHIIEPASGELASHLEGKGRMEEPENIIKVLEDYFSGGQDLQGKRILITAGPTYEKIDPVRFIGNYSSGKMGIALAEACARRGAEVMLVCGPMSLGTTQAGIRRIDVESAEDMFREATAHFPESDAAILCAAVADFTAFRSAYLPGYFLPLH